MMTNDRSLPSDLPTQLLIDGEWVDAEASRTFDVINPATEKPLVAIADASVDQGTDALDAAVRAQHSWADTAPRERAEILRKTFNLVTERKDDFARLMTLEMGKPLAESSARSRMAPNSCAGSRRRRYASAVTTACCRRATSVSWSPSVPSVRAYSSPHGTSRWRWLPARSPRLWLLGALW